MRYAIYLDDEEMENFFGNDTDADAKYVEYKERFGSEDIYDNITLYAFRTMKEEKL